MKSRHFFAGVNSPQGFFSCFDDIASDKKCVRKIYLKGGPGMGKSSLMKKIAERAEEEKYDTDIFHCSSDTNSLDGIFIPKLKTAVIDATAPHNYDPVYPGVTGEIFCTADYLDREKTAEHSEEIIHFSEHKKRAFGKAYNYLSAAAPVIDDIKTMYENHTYMHGINLEVQKAAKKYLPESTAPKAGELRRLFISAVAPDGFVNYTDSAFAGCRLISVRGGCGTEIFMRNIARIALSRGHRTEVFCCPMFPDTKPEHVILPDIGVAFTTYNHYHHESGEDFIDIDEYLREVPSGVDEGFEIASRLLRKAVNALADARAAHSFLEGFYTPYMDFEALSEDADRLTDKIFN